MLTFDTSDLLHPSRRAADLVDDLLARARELTPLVEFFRAHAEAKGIGTHRSFAEHVVDLLALGVRWHLHARGTLRRPAARPDHGAVNLLLLRLRAAGLPAAEVGRMSAWNEFALAECCAEALDEAVELADWFSRCAEARRGRSTMDLEEHLEAVRAEVLSRSLRSRRRSGMVLAPTPVHLASAMAPLARVALARATRAG
jgi:hypothetical protein